MFLLHVHEISWDFLKNSSHITSNLKILCFIIRIKCIFKCFFSPDLHISANISYNFKPFKGKCQYHILYSIYMY